MREKPLDVSKLTEGIPLIWVRDSRRSGAILERVEARFVKKVEKKCIIEVQGPDGAWHQVQVFPHRLRLLDPIENTSPLAVLESLVTGKP